jgi:hypothetical protein
VIDAVPAAALHVAAPPAWESAAAGFSRAVEAEGRVVVHRGERIVVRLDAKGRPHVESAGPAAGPILSGGSPVQDGTMVFTLDEDETAGWTLKAENGLPTAMLYGAMIGVAAGPGLGVARTSICTVPAGIVGLERWRDEVVLIALGPFAPRDADQLTCETIAAPPPGARDGAPTQGL